MKQIDITTTGLAVSKWLKGSVLIASALSLVACGGDDDDNMDREQGAFSYELKVTNLSHGQPFSPIGILVHGDDYTPWMVGQAASVALETLAEGGDNTAFIAPQSTSVLSGLSGAGLILPGATETIDVSLMADLDGVHQLSMATMLVNTNDGFVGANGIDLSALAVGETHTFYLPVYDAGTEPNSEAQGSIPGPADGGEGFNATRDDVDYVAMHPGVVGQDHGDGSSVLDSTHQFDGPLAKLTVARTQ